MYWIWKSLRAHDGEARIQGRPDVIHELEARFDEGVQLQIAVPPIRIVRDEDSQGHLTDNLLAPGTTGLLFSLRLRQLLTACGVHNIDYYPVVIDNPLDATRAEEYQLANLIGRVACVDLARSQLEVHPRSGVIETIDSLVLDETKAGELRMFRTAEHAQVVVVHEDIRNACVAAAITGVAFFRPEDFSL